MSSDKLVEIPQSQWPQLRDQYLSNWPVNMIGYYTIDNYIRWLNRRPIIQYLNFYSLNGYWSDGTFAVTDQNQLILNTLSESIERLTNLLFLLDWSHEFLISTLRKKHRSAVLNVIESKKLQKLFDEETLLYYISKDESCKLVIRIPDEMTLGNLTSEEVVVANSVWPFRGATSLHFLQRLAELNTNVGITTKDSGKLVAWCFRMPSGPLAALQVDEEYKRKGFGSLTLKLMAKELSEIEHDTCACVVLNNVASHEMFKKSGFEVIDNVFFIGTKPTNCTDNISNSVGLD